MIYCRDTGVSSLKNCWEIIKCEEKSFSTLVTGAFPPAKDQDSIIHELRAHRNQTLYHLHLSELTKYLMGLYMGRGLELFYKYFFKVSSPEMR